MITGTDVETEKIQALAQHLDIGLDSAAFKFDARDYKVLTDEEADEAVKDYICESAWAFKASFILEHTKLPYEAKEMIENFQEKCEGANDTILALITDFDKFRKDAVSDDGRGHFLAAYDSEENEEVVNGTTYFIYRDN